MADFLERDYKYALGEEISVETIEYFILLHLMHEERFKQLENEYRGIPEILDYEKKPSNKPDNRIVVSHGRYMVDMFDGFFIGKSVKVVGEKPETNEKLHNFARLNGIDDQNAELAKIASIYGYAMELIYQDEDSKTRVTYLNPKESFLVYDDTVQHRKLFGVYFKNGGKQVVVYTATEVIEFETGNDGNLKEINRYEHPFDGVPMIKYLHNEEQIGLYETALSMINHYNKAISEKANDVDYFADAYLKILGAHVEESDVARMRDYRTINIEGDGTSSIIAEFLEKPNADITQENLLDRLEKKIFQMCKVTDLTDERFGTATGVAKEMKLQDMSNQAIIKERKFQEALDERYRLFFSIPTNGTEEDWLSLKYTFYRNLPRDLEREAGLVSGLKGIVSDSTLLSQLSFVDDVQNEMDTIEEEKEDKIPTREKWEAYASDDTVTEL